MFFVGSAVLTIPPGLPSYDEMGYCRHSCSTHMPQPIQLTKVMFHMHYLGEWLNILFILTSICFEMSNLIPLGLLEYLPWIRPSLNSISISIYFPLCISHFHWLSHTLSTSHFLSPSIMVMSYWSWPCTSSRVQVLMALHVPLSPSHSPGHRSRLCPYCPNLLVILENMSQLE
jgi:hypothetical protein